MSLTIIDGNLYLPQSEFAYLYSVSELTTQSEIRESQRIRAEDRLWRSMGAGTRAYPLTDAPAYVMPWDYLPDSQAAAAMPSTVRPNAYVKIYAQVGEETIDGEVWPGPDEVCADRDVSIQFWTDKAGTQHTNGRADLSPTGPASLGGKIVLELCRRLGWETYLDELAQGYAAPNRLIPRVLQPPSNG